MKNLEYNRLLELKELIKQKKASKKEKDEYVEILYRNNNITKSQYDKYKANINTDEIINATLTIGTVLLAGWLLKKLLIDE